MATTTRLFDYFFTASLKDPLVPHTPASQSSAGGGKRKQRPVTGVHLFYESKEVCPSGCERSSNYFPRTSMSHAAGVCRLALGRDVNPPIIDVRFVKAGFEDQALQDGYHVIRTSSVARLSVKIRMSGRFVPTYAYVAVKRQVLSKKNLLRRVAPIVDVRLVCPKNGEVPPKGYVPCDCLGGKMTPEKSDTWMYILRGTADGLLDLAFEPKVVDRFPVSDHHDFDFPQSIEHFAFPHGAKFVLAGEQMIPMPRWSMFVLTLQDGTRVHGAIINFYDALSPDRLAELERNYGGSAKRVSTSDGTMDDAAPRTENGIRGQTSMELRVQRSDLFRPTAIGFLSHHSCCDGMKRLLGVLYRVSLSSSAYPLEHYVGHALLARVPREHRVLEFDWNGLKTRFPPVRDWEGLPATDVNYAGLFVALSVENVIETLRLLLLDKKIVFLTKHLHQITVVAEALRSLMFPLNWLQVYIPVCPDRMANFVRAPMPFVLGFSTEHFDPKHPSLPDDVFVVDLDNDRIYPCRSEAMRGAPLTGSHVDMCIRVLREEIETRCRIHRRREDMDIHELGFVFRGSAAARSGSCLDVHLDPNPTAVRGAVLQLMCAMLRGYNSCLKMMYNLNRTGDVEDMFNIKRFMDYTDPSLQEFVADLVEASPFTFFVEQCCQASSSDGTQFSRLYFDRCVRCFNDNCLPETPDGKTSEVPDLKEHFIDLQIASCIGDTSVPTTPVCYVLASPEEQVAESFAKRDAKDTSNPWDRLREEWLPSVLKGQRRLNSRDGDESSSFRRGHVSRKYRVPPLILRTSDERTVGESTMGSWRPNDGLPARKRCLDTLLADIHGAWALTLPSRVSAKLPKCGTPTERHARLIDAMSILSKLSPTETDQPLFRAFFESCVVSETATRENVQSIYKCLERKAPELPNALTYGQFSLALSHVQSFCPPNWTTELKRQRLRLEHSCRSSYRAVADASSIVKSLGRLRRSQTAGELDIVVKSTDVVDTGAARQRRASFDDADVTTSAVRAQNTSTLRAHDSDVPPKSSNGAHFAATPRRIKSISRLATSKHSDFLSSKITPTEKGIDCAADRAAGIELRIWTQSACEHCGYVPIDVEVMASWSGWTPKYTNSSTPVLRVGMVVEAIRHNNRLFQTLRGVSLKYCAGDKGVVLEVDGPSARVKWNDSVEHVSPNWRDCLKIIDAPFPGRLFELMRNLSTECERTGRKAPTYVNIKYKIIEQFGEAIFNEYKKEVQTALQNESTHASRHVGSSVGNVTPRRLKTAVKASESKTSSEDLWSERRSRLRREYSSGTSCVATEEEKKSSTTPPSDSPPERPSLPSPSNDRVATEDATKSSVESSEVVPKKQGETRPHLTIDIVSTERREMDAEELISEIAFTSSIPCPCCARMCVPQLHFEATRALFSKTAKRAATLPTGGSQSRGTCAHLSPHDFRRRLETFLIKHGLTALQNDHDMCVKDPVLFYNTLWYFQTFGLTPIRQDRERPKMATISQWTCPTMNANTSHSCPLFLGSALECLQARNVTGAVSLLLMTRRDAIESLESGKESTNTYEEGLAVMFGSTHVIGMSMYAVLLHMALLYDLVDRSGESRHGRTKAIFRDVSDFDSEYASAIKSLEDDYEEHIFALDRNVISREFREFTELYRVRLMRGAAWRNWG